MSVLLPYVPVCRLIYLVLLWQEYIFNILFRLHTIYPVFSKETPPQIITLKVFRVKLSLVITVFRLRRLLQRS